MFLQERFNIVAQRRIEKPEGPIIPDAAFGDCLGRLAVRRKNLVFITPGLNGSRQLFEREFIRHRGSVLVDSVTVNFNVCVAFRFGVVVRDSVWFRLL